MQLVIVGGLALNLSAQEDSNSQELFDDLVNTDLEESSNNQIVIEQTRELFRGTVGELDEEVMELRGDAIVSITEDSVVHRVRANLMRVNRTTGVIFATGLVEYEVIDASGSPQRFVAESLVLETTHLASIIVGLSNGEQPVMMFGDEVTFFYQAQQISKSANGTITLKGARVATSNAQSPYWSLQADMVWVLTDDNWVVRHPKLYMGRVPIFYFPFYYHGSNILFFNPVFGYSARQGFTINTTTHLWGRPSAQAGLGIFNFNPKPTEPVSNNRLAIMLDYYGRQGVMTGIWGGFDWADIDYKIGVAFTRTFFDDYSVAHPDDARLVWEKGYFFGKETPMRYGLQLEGLWQQLSMAVELYSDPRFKNDFFTQRRAGADWFGFLGFGSQYWEQNPSLLATSYLRYNNLFKIGLTGLDEIQVHFANSELLLEPLLHARRLSDVASSSHFYALRTLNVANTAVSLRAKLPFGEDFDNKASTEEQLRWWRPSFYYDVRLEERLSGSRIGVRYATPKDEWQRSALQWQNLFSNRSEIGTQIDWANRLELKVGFTNSLTHHTFLFDDNLTEQQKKQSERQNQLRLGALWQLTYSPFLKESYLGKSFLRYQAQLDFFENQYNIILNRRENLIYPNFRNHRLSGELRYDTGLYWAFAAVDGQQVKKTVQGEVKSGLGVDWYDWRTQSFIYVNKKDSTARMRYGWALESVYEPWSFVGLYGDLRVDFKTSLDYAEVAARLFGVRVGFVWQERPLQTWDRASFSWQPRLNAQGNSGVGFQPSYFYVRADQPLLIFDNYEWMKRNFQRWDLSLVGELRLDMVEYTQSKLEIGLRVQIQIQESFFLRITTLSYNSSMHLYVPFMRKELGIGQKFSFWQDVVNSFNFGNTQTRRESAFKLGRVQVDFEWRLPDWTIGATYLGTPTPTNVLDINSNGLWRQRFELWVKWRPIPALAAGVRRDEDGFWNNRLP